MPKIYVRLLFFISATLFTFNLNGQNVKGILSIGDEFFQRKDYWGALEIYENAMNIDSSDATVLYKYGKTYSLLNDHKKANHYLYKTYNIDKGKSFENLAFELAESYRYIEEYRKSKRYYSRAIRPYRRDKKSYWYQRITQSKKSILWANSIGKKTKDWKVKNKGLNLNSDASEFGARFHEDQIFYSALIADSLGENKVVLDKDYYTKIFVNNKSQSQELLFLENNKLKGKHLSNLSFTTSDEVYFSVCDTNFSCEIWSGVIKGNTIDRIKKLNKNINSNGHSNTQAQIVNIDKSEYLYFVSNRERGFGGFDIWVSKKETYGFDKPINIGGHVNTPGDEITPFYNPQNQTIYFSSDWHSGYGGFDIFKSKGGPITFSKAENLYKPINSNADEYYFNPDEGTALFTSNRKLENTDNSATCCNDIFEVNYVQDEFIETNPEKIIVSVDVLNDYLPLDLYFHNDSPNPNSKATTTDSDYKRLVQNYLPLKEEYEKKYSSQLHDTLKDYGEILIDDFFTNGVEAGMNSLEFFTPLLLKELQKGSHIDLTIKGYASSLSKSDYNLNLTYRRIESLINYFKNYDGGVFEQFLSNSNSNTGSLKINKLPFGEFAVENTQFEKNKILGVYSPEAAMQRKIEVLAVTKGNDKNTSNGSLLEIPIKKISLNRRSDMANKNHTIALKNHGNNDLKIYTVKPNCDCIELKYDKVIPANSTRAISYKLIPEKIIGEAKIVLEVFSESNHSVIEIMVTN